MNSTDSDIINSLAGEPIRPPEFVSLEDIINNVPNMNARNPTTFFLYLHYNDKWLSKEEKNQIEIVMEKLKIERDMCSTKNIGYLERWKKETSQKTFLEE